MPQDAFTLNVLCKELDKKLSGGKINRIVQPSKDEIVFTIYTGTNTKKLSINANPSLPYIRMVEKEGVAPLVAPNFCMLLRKHLLSATIKKIEIVGFDRIVKITTTVKPEFSEEMEKVLYVELMGRYSNVILTENEKILGKIRGANLFEDVLRPMYVGKKYTLPPSNNKKNAKEEDLSFIEEIQDDLTISERIFSNVQGVSKITAEELERQYLELKSKNKNVGFDKFAKEFLLNPKICPCTVYQNEQVKDIFAILPTGINADLKFFDSIIDAQEDYFLQRIFLKELKAKKEKLAVSVNNIYKKTKKKLGYVLEKEKECLDLEENKIKGELILSYIYLIKKGDQRIELANYYDNNRPIIVELDSRLSPSKNAENYYKKYNKQKRTIDKLFPQKQDLEKELDYLENLAVQIELIRDIKDCEMVMEELEKSGYNVQNPINSKKKQNDKPIKNYREYEVNGFTIKVGRNNIENDKLVSTAKSESIWLHSKSFHSSHVIIENNGKEINEEIIKVAGEICAFFSKARYGGKTEVVYTIRKNVKKPPKSKPGFVIYDKFKSIEVNPNEHKDLLKSIEIT